MNSNREHRSTSKAKIVPLRNFDHRSIIIILFSAAFDKVWHNGLIYKMIKLKLPLYLVNYFIEFLRDRKYRVCVDGFVTKEYKITTGTPQGAVN